MATIIAGRLPRWTRPRKRIASVLRAGSAQQIERAEGRLEHGEWIDFDPRTPACLVDPQPVTSAWSAHTSR